MVGPTLYVVQERPARCGRRVAPTARGRPRGRHASDRFGRVPSRFTLSHHGEMFVGQAPTVRTRNTGHYRRRHGLLMWRTVRSIRFRSPAGQDRVMSRKTMRSTGPVITPIVSLSRMHTPFPQSWSRSRSAELMLKNSLPSRILGIQSGSSDEVRTTSATSLIAGSSSVRSRRLRRRFPCQSHRLSIQSPRAGSCTYRHRSGAEYISIRIGDMFAASSCRGHPMNSE